MPTRSVAKGGAGLALALLTSLVRGLRKLGVIAADGGRPTLVLPPAAPGNLGDDAMVSATLQYLRRSGVKRLGIVALGSSGAEWRKWQPEVAVLDVRASIWGKAKFVVAVMRFERLYCLGADIMDGYHDGNHAVRIAELASLASAVGVRAAILGFSYNDRPTPESVRLLHGIPRDVRLCVRDPISYQRLAARLDRPIELVADVAFLLDARHDTRTVATTRRWIESERAASRIVLGLNFNHRVFLQSEGADLGAVIDRFREAVTALFGAGEALGLLFIPHDYRRYRGYPGDEEVAVALLATLPEEVREHSRVVERCRASEIRAICGQLDFVVTGLMHLAIAALEQTTPVACLSYQGKFEGLMSQLNLDELNMHPNEALGGLKERILPLIARREEIREKIASRLPAIKTLAEANFM